MITKYKNQVIKGKHLSYDNAIELSKVEDKQALYLAADEIRKHFCGNKIDLCSITNAKSGKCSQDCKWCSQSAHYDTGVEEYDIVDTIKTIKEAIANNQQGVQRHSLVTSGRRATDKTIGQLIGIYKNIQKKSKISLCASLGLLTGKQLERLKNEVGIDHYHCNLETAPSYFPKLVTKHTQEEKIATIKEAQARGIKICSGGIIGMGESMEQRIELAIELQKLKVDSIPINILMPIKGTPLENVKPLSEEEILTTISLFRFLNPKANLRIAGGRLQIKHFQHKALRAGISAALTGDYLTSTGANIKQDIVNFEAAGFEITKN